MNRMTRIFIVVIAVFFAVTLPIQEVNAISKADYIRNNIDYYDPDSIGCQAAGSGDTSGNLSVKERVQQTIFLGFDVNAFGVSKIKSALLKYKPGGVFFTDVSAANAKKLDKSFFDGINKKLPSPLIVSSDDEGGAVNRFYNNPYSAKKMGGMSNSKVSQLGSATGTTLKKHGVNLDLAPVLDLDAHKSKNEISRDGRSFSSNPTTVATKAGAFASGVTSTGVGVVFKHFPGLRVETTNTDTGKNTYSGSIASLSKDIQPYKKLASTAKSAVMLSNMYITAWGSDPVSINKKAVSYLRSTVKFNGPIITDDLSALGKYSGMSMQVIVQKAYNAGVTMPLFSYKSDSQMDKIISTSASNVGQGAVSAAYNDTMAFKSTLGLSTGSTTPVSPVKPMVTAPIAPTGGGGQNQNLVNIYGYLLAKGLSPEQAAGGVGNISQESGGDPTIIQGGKHSKDPSAAGGGGWGIIQWTPGKKVIGLASQAGASGPIYELSTQEDIVWWHVNDTTPTGARHFINTYKKITDVTKATESWEKNMEAAGVPNMPARIKAAKLALSTYPRTPSQVTSSCGDSGSGVTGDCSVTQPIHGEDGSKDKNQMHKKELVAYFGKGGKDGQGNMTSVDFMGKNITVNKKIVGCLNAVQSEIKSKKIDYTVKEAGGYRASKGAGRASLEDGYHYYGAAIDINPSTNPYSDSGAKLNYDIPQSYVDAFHHHGFSWGGGWDRPKDYMHFEFNGFDPGS